MISQREARRLQKRVAELERLIVAQRQVWSQDYFGGVQIASAVFSGSATSEVIRTARKLGHAVVCVGNETDTVRFVALPHPDAGL